MEGYLLLTLMVLSLTMFQFQVHARQLEQLHTEYLKTSCKTTMYPDLCYESLQTHAGEIKGNPKALALRALTVALDAAKQSQTELKKLSGTNGLSPSEAGAMADCVKGLGSAVEHIVESKNELSSVAERSPSRFKMSNVQTWVSAALTNENTCKDGFEDHNLKGKVQASAITNTEKVGHLTSISLAFINNFAKSAK